jgi:hypothetical protein
MSEVYGPATSLSGVVVVVAIATTVVFQIQRYFESAMCPVFAVESGFETKFVDYNLWNFECLAKTTTGTRVPIERLREVDDDDRHGRPGPVPWG